MTLLGGGHTEPVNDVDTTSGVTNVYLPTAATLTGTRISYSKSDLSPNPMVLLPSDTAAINNKFSYELTLPGDSVTLYSDGVNWWTVATAAIDAADSSVYGDGRDLDQVISVDTTLTAVLMAKTLIVAPGVKLTTAGFPVFATQWIDVQGTIDNSGLPGADGANGGAGGNPGSVGYYGSGGKGGNGNAAAGSNGTAVTNSVAVGTAGNGGGGGATAGGTAGTVGALAEALGGLRAIGILSVALTGLSQGTQLKTGPGGGGGGGEGVVKGGGGGGGGGFVMLAAPIIKSSTGAGLISAIGGNGGAGDPLGNTGGGGGGCGGCVILISRNNAAAAGCTIDTSGGIGGAGNGTGVQGSNGSVSTDVIYLFN